MRVGVSLTAGGFVVAAAVATAIPWLGVLAGYALGVSVPVDLLIVAFGGVHVGTTAAFYFDPDMRAVLNSDRRRYYLAAGGVILAGGVAALSPAWAIGWVVIPGFTYWQLHHFTRQNLGMISFVLKAGNGGRMGADHRRVIDLTGYAAILGVTPLVLPRSDIDPMWFRLMGLTVLCLAAALAVRSTREATPLLRWSITGAMLFYLPLFVIGDLATAALAYALAHGAQYLVMVGHLPAGRDAGGRVRMAVVVAASFVLVGLPYHFASQAFSLTSGHRVVGGLLVGVTAAHFIVDAGVWKLSEPLQREAMQRRFAFLR